MRSRWPAGASVAWDIARGQFVEVYEPVYVTCLVGLVKVRGLGNTPGVYDCFVGFLEKGSTLARALIELARQ